MDVTSTLADSDRWHWSVRSSSTDIHLGNEVILGSLDKLAFDTQVKVYPNPFNSLLIFDIGSIPTEIRSLKIIDAMGKSVYHLTPDNLINENGVILLNLSLLASGIHYYEIISENNRYTSTLIKSN